MLKLGQEKVYFTSQHSGQTLHGGKSSQESGGKNGSRGHEGSLLVPLPLLSLLSYTPQDPLPRDDTTRSGLGPPIITTDYENIPQAVYRPILWKHLSPL